MKPPTANEITNALLIEIPRRFGADSVVCWRNNTGAGVGWSIVKAAVRLLKAGNIKGGIALLMRPIRWGLVGSADILMIIGPNGRMCGIEVKAEGDEQSPAQIAWEMRVRALGAVYVVAESVEQCLADLEAAR